MRFWDLLARKRHQATRFIPEAFFYEALHGWKHQSTMEMPTGPYRLFMASKDQGGGLYLKPPDMPMPPLWMFYILVADIDGALARCKQLGGKVVYGPMEVPDGDRVAVCIDPQGAGFGLQQKK